MKNNNKNYHSRAILLNPIAIILYAIACYYIAGLAEYGGISRRMPIILLTVGLLVIWFLWSFFKPTPKRPHSKLERYAKPWFYIAVTLIIIITGVTTYDVYQSSINYQGKLSWLIQDLKSTRKITFENNNIYEHELKAYFKILIPKSPCQKLFSYLMSFLCHLIKRESLLQFTHLCMEKTKKARLKPF